jgi:phosphatidylserine/phosphatidylglycerophosphate/cardiolipin synthase-like enzyme
MVDEPRGGRRNGAEVPTQDIALDAAAQRLRRLHRKIVVVDQKIAFVGGININDDTGYARSNIESL